VGEGKRVALCGAHLVKEFVGGVERNFQNSSLETQSGRGGEFGGSRAGHPGGNHPKGMMPIEASGRKIIVC